MLEMQVNNVLVLSDRVILGGNPDEFTELPTEINVFEKKHKVLGLSSGIKPPFISLEIEKKSKINYSEFEGSTIKI